jgi:hypothetical protein
MPNRGTSIASAHSYNTKFALVRYCYYIWIAIRCWCKTHNIGEERSGTPAAAKVPFSAAADLFLARWVKRKLSYWL